MTAPDEPPIGPGSVWARPGERTAPDRPASDEQGATDDHATPPAPERTTRYDQPTGYAPQPGLVPHPGFAPQPGYGQPGYGQRLGYGQPGYGLQPGFGPTGTSVWAPPGGAAPPGARPGWGQPGPGWGGPYPSPTRRSFPWKPVAIVLGALLLIALVVVGLLAFFVGPRFARVDVLDADAVAQGVTRVVTEDWRRQITDVSCPSDQQIRPGVRFTCTATVDGRPAQVPVAVMDANGTYAVGQPR